MPDFIKLTLIIAASAILIGLADILVTLAFTYKNRPRNIVIGAAFMLVGAALIWLSLDRGVLEPKLIDTDNNLCGLLLMIFVFSLFVVRAVMDIRGGQKQLNETGLPKFLVWKGTLRTISGAIMIVFIIFLLLMFLSWSVR